LNFIFWNTGRNGVEADVADLIVSTKADFVALAEYAADSAKIIAMLHGRGVNYHAVPTIGCERIKILASLELGEIAHKREADRYSIVELRAKGAAPVLIALVHLPSKLHAADVDQLQDCIFFKLELEAAERDAGHANTIVLGDFNMNPFDQGMVSAAAMNSLPCLKTAKRETRVVSGKSHSFFYNPSWNLLGDLDDSPGTYFNRSPHYLSHYWNMLDQVVIRPSIADRFDKASLRILRTTGTKSLVNDNGRPSVSDHLPIFFSFRF
jgi:hypothetical protein